MGVQYVLIVVMVEINPNETVRLIERTTGNRVRIVTGESSSTGKTVKIDTRNGSCQLDTVKLKKGRLIKRRNCFYELYDPEEFHRQQKMNESPPQIAGGVNPSQIKDTDKLPPATHKLDRDY